MPLVVHVAAGDEQEVRQAIDVLMAGALTGSLGWAGKLDDQALGAPADGARHVQGRGRRRAARQDEGSQRLQLARSARRSRVLEPRDLRRR